MPPGTGGRGSRPRAPPRPRGVGGKRRREGESVVKPTLQRSVSRTIGTHAGRLAGRGSLPSNRGGNVHRGHN